MRIKIFIVSAIILGITVFLPIKSNSCPIPVFRYALEFWEEDPYMVDVFYKNSLDADEKELVNYLLNASSADNDMKANLDLRSINAGDQMDDITRGFLNNLSPPELPWIVVRYPRVSGNNNVIWSGPLNKENVQNLINSPARESIAAKLAGNATAVWVLLESGDRSKDRKTYDLLNNELRRLEQTLVLPDLDLWYENTSGDPDAEPVINFQIVTLSRSDAREEPFVKMLVNTEDDLLKFDSEPIVFPFYGRGIALWAIVGRGINEWNIMEAAEFLTGPCSCQAKLLNPGTDMLLSMNWNNVVENITDISLANPLSGMGDFSSREAEARSQLESATNKHFGTATNQRESRATDSDKVVYIDIFGKDEEQTRGREDAEKVEEVKKEQEVPKEDKADGKDNAANDTRIADEPAQARQGPESPLEIKQEKESRENDSKRKFGSTQILLSVFAGIILIILLSGIILYRKH